MSSPGTTREVLTEPHDQRPRFSGRKGSERDWNGPARTPPGPLVSVRSPLIPIVRRPLLWTFATTSGCPVEERFAVSAPDDELRTPARRPTRRNVHPDTDAVHEPYASCTGADTSAQMTA